MILEVPFIMENVEKQKLIYDMLNAHPEIDGIFAGDDSLAVIALHIARQKGINIPNNTSICFTVFALYFFDSPHFRAVMQSQLFFLCI